MDFFSGGNDLGTLSLGLAMAAVAVGLFSGVLRRGSGLILVPILFFVARGAAMPVALSVRMAVGTAFAALLPLALYDAAANAKASEHRPSLRTMLAASAGLAALMVVVWRVPAEFLTIGFSVLALATAVLMVFGKEQQLTGSGAILLVAAATAAGTLTAIVAGWETPGLPHTAAGYVNGFYCAIIAPLAFGASMAVRHFAGLIDAKRQRFLFALVAVLPAAKMVWDVLR